MIRMFGTDGVRGIANMELTANLAYNLGRAGAFVLTEGAHKPKILVGKDTRISGDMLESALVAGILSVGAEAVILGVVPTPAVAHLTRKYNADAGIMISASHNPVEYNGIKFFDEKGYKLSDELEDQIQSVIEGDFYGVPSPVGTGIGRQVVEIGALDEYIDFAKGTTATNLEGMKIALDCANGSAYEAAVRGFRELNAEIYVINDNPDGTNINEKCGSTHPEELMDYVVRKGCDMGFAFDGDADRCLAVDEKGNLINGDFILTICAKHLKEINRLKDDTVVVTVMSNLGLDIACQGLEINALKTRVGDRYVLEEMIKGKYVLGGEQSGHIIFLDYNTTGDGLVTALQIASIVKKQKKTLSELCSIMTNLPQVLANAVVPNDKKNIYLEDEEIKEEIKRIERKLQGKGRVLIRPSGTEPLVRVMLEGENQEELNKMAHNLADMIVQKCR
ncbi:phosphoglucosamine mutase [Clostridium vincentii]|uniref:Phosphoglucosamine mutase n=1 Tax=Clostridium vincentii TaxID=52704 RepID=A0A2T0BI83_9CLOT|nr:phosphoglucosamine mutase [Clostridium vincentii]PRR83600.1 Phosphoglucosamine mutase [Clostridium vincentii]